MLKQVVNNQASKSFPANYVLVIFEGAWNFSPDPQDASRILAVCPYTQANDPFHVCDFGLWQGTFGGIPGATDSSILIAGDHPYRLEVQNGDASHPTFTELFETAWEQYKFVYVRNKIAGNPFFLSPSQGMRRVSFPIPNEVRAAGQLLNTPVLVGSDPKGIFVLGAENATVSNYVAFLFLYNCGPTGAAVTLSSDSLPTPATLPSNSSNPHLLFRVYQHIHGGEDGDELDHTVTTFNRLRTLTQVQDPATAQASFLECDFNIYPQTTDQQFLSSDSPVSDAEIGLPPLQAGHHQQPTGMDLSSCAAGMIVSDPTPPSSTN